MKNKLGLNILLFLVSFFYYFAKDTKNDSTLAKWTPYAYHRYKFRNAVEHGAAGLLYVGKIANPNTVYPENAGIPTFSL